MTLELNWSFRLPVVWAVQVKVEELEMEAPILPPESPTTLPVSSVKEEEEGEPIRRDPERVPEQEETGGGERSEGAEQGEGGPGEEAPHGTPEK